MDEFVFSLQRSRVVRTLYDRASFRCISYLIHVYVDICGSNIRYSQNVPHRPISLAGGVDVAVFTRVYFFFVSFGVFLSPLHADAQL